MNKRDTKYLLRPDGLIYNIFAIVVIVGFIFYAFITGEYKHDHMTLSCLFGGIIGLIPITSTLGIHLATVVITPYELVWKRSIVSRPVHYPSEKITLIRICFGIHPFFFHHAKYDSLDWAAANTGGYPPAIAISHRRRLVELCCTYRKKLFLRLVECCPNAKIVANTNKGRPLPKRYREFLTPYLDELNGVPLRAQDEASETPQGECKDDG